MLMGLVILYVVFAIPVALACGSVVFAAESARRTHVKSRLLAWGAALAFAGLFVMALVAWSTREDKHYDDFGSALQTLAALIGGSLFLTGLGPATPWLLNILRRRAARLSPVIRLAARDVDRNSRRTAAPIAITMVLTAFAVASLIIAVATTAQSRAGYQPQARPGTLVVNVWAEDASIARAVIQQELPGAPVAQKDVLDHQGYFSLDVKDVDLPDVESVHPAGSIGDQAFLRYLTGNPATPYDDGTAVVVTPDDIQVDTVTLSYSLSTDKELKDLRVKSIPAIAVRSADPHVNEVFIPPKVVRDLGLRLEPDKLIVDPSAHRTTKAEQDRIDRRLGDGESTYVERGFQESAGWMGVVAAAIGVALGSALVAGGRAGAGGRSRRVLLRVSNGSVLTLRMFAASRSGLSMFCGTALGAAAGCVIGLLVAWPSTTSIGWEVPQRVSFETPWWAIAGLVAGLPVLAGIIAALPGPRVRGFTRW
ncbi:hypothetical protein ABGB14_32005 [Nonomuraea sp. B10E15]|uniref:hypothetical protein n=1 Tax=Nonomuraea sp. B10E15 TaxID=3153560 RepID=UPI00325E7BF8